MSLCTSVSELQEGSLHSHVHVRACARSRLCVYLCTSLSELQEGQANLHNLCCLFVCTCVRACVCEVSAWKGSLAHGLLAVQPRNTLMITRLGWHPGYSWRVEPGDGHLRHVAVRCAASTTPLSASISPPYCSVIPRPCATASPVSVLACYEAT